MSAEEPVDVRVLGTPLTFPISKRTARNRFLKAALTERVSTWDPTIPECNGIPSEMLVNMYEKWGNGGFGVILTGNVMVDPTQLESAGNMIIAKELEQTRRSEQFSRVAKAAKSDGALAILQLGHAGRQTPITVNPHPFSASDVQLKAILRGTGFGVPVPLTTEQVKTEVIDRFVFAARFSHDAGFDGIQLHAAHGYLLSQFMSPTTNKRTDCYGGSIENRSRLILEIYHAIKEVVPKDFVVGIKMNSVEFQHEGLQTDDATKMCEMMEEAGFDFIELSGGTLEHLAFAHHRESTKAREAFFLDFAEQIVKRLKKCVIYLTGGFRSAKGMVSAVENGSTQGIGLGRPITQEPDLPKKILNGESKAAKRSLLNQYDFGETNIASNTQMAQAGEEPMHTDPCEGIMDLSDQATVEAYRIAMSNYVSKVAETANKGLPIYGVLQFRAH